MSEKKKAFETHAENFEKSAPKHWVLIRFDEVCDVTDYVANGSFASLKENVNYKKEKDYAVLVRYTDHAKKWSGNYVYVNKKSFDFLRKSTVYPGDIIIANVGDPGKVFQVPDLGQPMTLGPNSVLVRPDENLDRDYIAKFFSCPWGQDLINEITTGTAQRKFNKTGLRSTVIPIPPVNEQKRIVDRIEQLFSDLDEGEALLKTVQKQLVTYRQSVLKSAVTGELTKDWREKNKKKLESGEKLLARILESRRMNWKGKGKYKAPEAPNVSSLPVLPNEWTWASVELLCRNEKHAIKAGPFGSALKKEFYVDDGYKIYGQEQVISGDWEYGDYYIDEDKYNSLESCKVQPFDILISLVGTIGKVLVLPENIKQGIINPRLIKLSPDLQVYDPNFFKFYFESAFLKSIYKLDAHGATMDILNLGIIKGLPFILCSLEEQKEIVSRIEDIFSQIDVFEALCTAELKRSNTLRQSILKSAFSGKLVAQDPSDEPASELLKSIQAGGSETKKDKAKEKPTRRGRKSSSDKTEAA